MKLYVISADTYEDSYGATISIFGVYDSLEKAKEAIEELNDRYLYSINEMELNKTQEIYLGGYYE